ncbi:hypothetical protein ASPZODRAFT_134113 [Penicilliopsis zonata CBS 506.65]|uniref:Uncharacterized protein n=1 Tax=Penicilliopsis zonata CBS 506.65 TaxID=1073090 RepID=A0A1L9SE14_9EURO|nr:hypothetical protein ASPZODRAFT_134113 [Penicilliopsis zonata CBS 506.65]OJJ45460.1 hypothetical protein ASPZODRAFT_134113 [Penicilliopsis zonata CBS 506.65]
MQALNDLLPPKRDLPFVKPTLKKPTPAAEQPKQTHPARQSSIQPDTRANIQSRGMQRGKTSAADPEGSGSLLALQPPPLTPVSTVPENQPRGSPFISRGTMKTSIGRDTTTPTTIARPTPADFSSYLSLPDAERAASVESWICQQLEDDAFIQLCRDVEGVWQRIAFGR